MFQFYVASINIKFMLISFGLFVIIIEVWLLCFAILKWITCFSHRNWIITFQQSFQLNISSFCNQHLDFNASIQWYSFSLWLLSSLFFVQFKIGYLLADGVGVGGRSGVRSQVGRVFGVRLARKSSIVCRIWSAPVEFGSFQKHFDCTGRLLHTTRRLIQWQPSYRFVVIVDC